MARLDEWRFCPRCGAAIEREGRHALCGSCGFEEWANAAPAVEALVVRDGRVLLVRRGVEPHRGRWDLPGGFLEEDEPALDGLRRELREETGLELEIGDFVDSAVEPYARWSVLTLTWLATCGSEEPVAADDVAEVAWFGPDELPAASEFAFAHHAALVERWACGLLRGSSGSAS